LRRRKGAKEVRNKSSDSEEGNHMKAFAPADRDTPKVNHTIHLREFEFPDGRKLMLDRRSIGFLCQAKPEEFGGKVVTIVGFKTMAKACPIKASYADLVTWWKGESERTRA
jgi:hypothetical protein